MNSSQYLYYQVGEYKTTNKLLAVEAAGGDMSRVHFYFADNEHRQHDWTREPEESVYDLIDQRVRALREEYSYLALWYSAGYDSHTILESILRTNTRLDEILIYCRSYIKTHDNIEAQVALQQAQLIKTHLQPWLKIRYIEYDQDTTFKFYQEHGSDWMYYGPGENHNFSKTYRYNTALYHKDFIGLDHIVGRCDINGVDKPRVNLRDGKWYAQMPDVAITAHLNSPRHLFYLCPEATQLYIKQVWMIVKWLESRPDCSHDFVQEVQGKRSNRSLRERGDLYAEWNMSFGRSRVVDSVSASGYNKHWSDTSVTNGLDSIVNPDSAVLKDLAKKTNPTIYNHWLYGLQYLNNKYPDIWTPLNGFKVCMSSAIYIKDFTPTLASSTTGLTQNS
jgi:hypothetical protein